MKKEYRIRKDYDFVFCIILEDGVEIPIGECYGISAQKNAKKIVDLLNEKEPLFPLLKVWLSGIVLGLSIGIFLM